MRHHSAANIIRAGAIGDIKRVMVSVWVGLSSHKALPFVQYITKLHTIFWVALSV